MHYCSYIRTLDGYLPAASTADYPQRISFAQVQCFRCVKWSMRVKETCALSVLAPRAAVSQQQVAHVV